MWISQQATWYKNIAKCKKFIWYKPYDNYKTERSFWELAYFYWGFKNIHHWTMWTAWDWFAICMSCRSLYDLCMSGEVGSWASRPKSFLRKTHRNRWGSIPLVYWRSPRGACSLFWELRSCAWFLGVIYWKKNGATVLSIQGIIPMAIRPEMMRPMRSFDFVLSSSDATPDIDIPIPINTIVRTQSMRLIK